MCMEIIENLIKNVDSWFGMSGSESEVLYVFILSFMMMPELLVHGDMWTGRN